MPNFYSLLNALGSMNVGLMQMHAFVAIIEDILSSHDKNQIHVQYTTKRACTLIVNVPVIIEPFHQYSRNGNLSWLILIPTPSKPTAYSSVFSSWRLLNQENARTRATWRTVYRFLITGSEHEDVISVGSGEPALLCNLVRVTLLTNSKFLSG